MNSIGALIHPEDILLDLEARTKSELFDAIGRHMEKVHDMKARCVVLGLERREMVGSTGLGEGVAIPHTRVPDLKQVQLAFIHLKSPIDFGAPDGKPVSDLLILLVPKHAAEEHLQILAEAAQMFGDRVFRAQLKACGCADEVKRLFDVWPAIF